MEFFKIKNYFQLIPQVFIKSCSRKFLLRLIATHKTYWWSGLGIYVSTSQNIAKGFFRTKSQHNSFWKCHCSIFSESLSFPKSNFKGIRKISLQLFSLPALGEQELFSVLFHLASSCIHVSDFAHCFHDMLLNADKKVHVATPGCLA